MSGKPTRESESSFMKDLDPAPDESAAILVSFFDFCNTASQFFPSAIDKG
jgi:hypothetical protein